MRHLYYATKKLAKKYIKPERPVKNKDCKTITVNQDQQNRWVEHFEEHLNKPTSLNSSVIEIVSRDHSVNIDPPTIEEVNMAVRQLMSGKSVGPNNIPAEELKSDIGATAKTPHILSRNIYEEE